MSPTAHKIYIGFFATIIVATSLALAFFGYDYYQTPLEERFYHPNHQLWKPSGILGHGLGIIGTLFIMIGVFSYMARKRIRRFSRIGVLKYWLEFHIFLCILGPILVLFHTAFKFGGIVSISFWSMVIVVASGVIGRFIYIQIPKTIQGRHLTLEEIQASRFQFSEGIENELGIPKVEFSKLIRLIEEQSAQNRFQFSAIDKELKALLLEYQLKKTQFKKLKRLLKKEVSINKKIRRLDLMRKLFGYWHIAHLPFAIIMLLIMIIHVVITLSFGYKWIF